MPQERDKMTAGSGKILNEDDTEYDFTLGFRALLVRAASMVVTLANILVQVSRGVIDSATGAFATISYPHHEIHEGCTFLADINTVDLDDEGNNDALHLSFTTPNTTKWGHLIYGLYTSGQASFEIVEAPTGGVAGGSAKVPINHNRNVSDVSTMKSTHDGTAGQLTVDATAPTGGTVLHHEELGSGKNKQSGEGREDNEFILKQNTTYSFRMTSAVGDITAQMTLNWYEKINAA